MPRLALVALLVPLLVTQAVGQPKGTDPNARAQAKERFLAAEQEYKSGRFGNALEGYYESFVLSSEPLLLYNMAQCYRNLGRYAEAVDTYKEFLARAPETPFSPRAQEWIDELSPKLAALAPPAPPAPTSQPAPSESQPASAPVVGPRIQAPNIAALQQDQVRISLSSEELGVKRARRLFWTGGGFVAGGLALGGATLLQIVNTRNLQQTPDTDTEAILQSRRRSLLVGVAADLSFAAAGVFVWKGFSLAATEKTAPIEFSAAPALGGAQVSLRW